jgi:hypothetical protein
MGKEMSNNDITSMREAFTLFNIDMNDKITTS